MFCYKCGVPNNDGVKFCRGCGANLETVTLAVTESTTKVLHEQPR